MVVKETLRLHPVIPLAIGRDPEAWTDTGEFFCEKGLFGSRIDLRGHDFQFLPFGSDRRGCLGSQLGRTVVRQGGASKWMMPSELDMTKEFSLVTPRAKHLLASYLSLYFSREY
ncbi:hypothetical protein Pint_26773 [Pistacia integerrima]|uniref:Uncharacterized protein n=1 Tax=Pistacia integerrima TaxID=434235 RepID=A0ACC0YPQ4_9ROSI|nr:hypothetical protein Pint_26773 [Pistacia integerrima]